MMKTIRVLKRVHNVSIDVNTAKYWNDALSLNKQHPDGKESQTLDEFTVDFGNGINVDIKLCNGDTGPWIDSILFENGNEIFALEPCSEKVEGEYSWPIGDDTEFLLIVEIDK